MQTFFVEIKCVLGRTYEVASALAEAELDIGDLFDRWIIPTFWQSFTSRAASISGISWVSMCTLFPASPTHAR